MNKLGQRMLMAQQWRHVFASEGELTDNQYMAVSKWLDDGRVYTLIELLRVAHAAGKLAGR